MSRTLLSLAGFQVIISGRFWVIAEDSGMPISGFTAVVGECKYPDSVRHFQVSNVVGEAFNRCLAGGWYVSRDTGNLLCGLRPAGDMVERCIDRFEELAPESWSSALVPDSSIFKLAEASGSVRKGRFTDQLTVGQHVRAHAPSVRLRTRPP
jgi:hypothetical protein